VPHCSAAVRRVGAAFPLDDRRSLCHLRWVEERSSPAFQVSADSLDGRELRGSASSGKSKAAIGRNPLSLLRTLPPWAARGSCEPSGSGGSHVFAKDCGLPACRSGSRSCDSTSVSTVVDMVFGRNRPARKRRFGHVNLAIVSLLRRTLACLILWLGCGCVWWY